MEFLPFDDFSDNQRQIVTLKLEGNTYSQIQNIMSFRTGRAVYAHHISLCLSRSALGYKWDFGIEVGNLAYLCPSDMKMLSEIVENAYQEGSALDTMEVLDEATKLKGQRLEKGLSFLSQINSNALAQRIADQTVFTPSRTWLNSVLADLDAHIRKRQLIDSRRLEAASYETIERFFLVYSRISNRIPPALLFTVDETMLDTTLRQKVVVRSGIQSVVEQGFPNMPHITGMMACNVFGQGPPPLIIFKDLRCLPDELKMFSDSHEAWFSSTPSGYMTKDMFVFWTLCFINWLSHFRLTLSSHLHNSQALIILDGHTSRENPLAMALLKKARINVLCLPSHTTHVLQIFDVSLASPLKRIFGTVFKKELKKKHAKRTIKNKCI